MESGIQIEAVVQELELPPGLAGPEAAKLDVRCFLVAHRDGLVLVDTGLPGSVDGIGAALDRAGAGWDDITDVVLTHAHPDHVGGLADVMARSPGAVVRAGAADCPAIHSAAAVQPLIEGDRVRNLAVLATPGHTPGHISLLHERGALFVGDAVGSLSGSLQRAPAPFTADAGTAEESLRRLAGLAPERMLFSHGPEIPEPVAALRKLTASRP